MIGDGARVRAYLMAPNGTVRFANGAAGVGTFIGRWVDTGTSVRLNLGNGLNTAGRA